jgi:integrase
MRKGEIFSLKIQDVDFFRKTLIVVKSKTKKKRTIPLNNAAFELLIKRSKVIPISGYVFSTGKGTRITARNLSRAFDKAVKKANVSNFRFNDLRHTFATRLVQAGVDIYKVSKLLGHTDISTTQRYAHHYPESLRDGIEILDVFPGKNLSQPKEVLQFYDSGCYNSM